MAAAATLTRPTSDPRARKLSDTEVQKLLNANKTPRVFELEGYQAFFEGKAYEGRPHFYTDDIPLQQRKPIVVYPIVKLGVESNVAFAMGESRFPKVLSLSSEDDQVFDKNLGLSKDESAVLDAFTQKLIETARLEQVFRQAYRMAQAAKSVAIVLGFRAGLPFADLVWSKLCTPSFDDPTDPYKCTRLEIRYRYTEQWRDTVLTGGQWWTRVLEYLRVIDDKADTVYQPAAIWDVTDAGVVAGSSTALTSQAHGFGFCPVHWYARNRESVVGATLDGKALHEGICGLVEQLDFALSQRHRAAIYAGDPQTVLTGVADEDIVDLGAKGSTIAPVKLLGDYTKEGQAWQRGFGGPQQGGPALKRGVLYPWRIKDSQGKAVVLALPGDALKALDDDAKDLAARVCDGLGIIVLDPAAFKGGGDLSGRTLAFIFSKQINLVSQDREDVGRCCMLPTLNLFYRMLVARSDGVYLPGLPKVLPILQRFYRPVAGQQTPTWFAPYQQLKWGDYFEPSDVDEATRTQTSISAYNAKIITLKTAVEHVRGVFQIASVDQYVDTLQDEVDQRQQQAIANAQAIAGPPGQSGSPAAQKAPSAAPPASGAPKPKRNPPAASK